MSQATVTCPWSGDGLTTQTAFRPQLAVDYPAVTFPDGVPGIYTDPTVTVTFLCDATTLAQIQADVRYAGKVTVQQA